MSSYDRVDHCRSAIRDKMKYLEPLYEDPVEEALPKGGWKIRQRVRLADSFSAAAVGDIECGLDAKGYVTRVSKIAR